MRVWATECAPLERAREGSSGHPVTVLAAATQARASRFQTTLTGSEAVSRTCACGCLGPALGGALGHNGGAWICSIVICHAIVMQAAR